MEPLYHPGQQKAEQLPLFVFTRVCTKCGKEKPLEAFNLSKNGLYGRRADCTQCKVAANRERKLHPKVKPVPRPGYKFCSKCGEEKLYPQEFVKRAAECKECKAAYQRERRQTPEYKEYDRQKHRKHKAYYAAQYLKTKEAYRARERVWRKANPERARARALRRKAHKLSAQVDQVDYKAIIERDGYVCYICGKPIDPTVKSRTSGGLTFDHRIPLQPRPGEPQGTHTADNIFPAHHACNVRKSNIPFELLTPWQRRGV